MMETTLGQGSVEGESEGKQPIGASHASMLTPPLPGALGETRRLFARAVVLGHYSRATWSTCCTACGGTGTWKNSSLVDIMHVRVNETCKELSRRPVALKIQHGVEEENHDTQHQD